MNEKEFMSEKEQMIVNLNAVVENARVLIDLTEKAQRQSAELRKTLFEIEKFEPIIRW